MKREDRISAMEKIMEEMEKHADSVLLITADHGNADCMFDENGKVNTAHTTNLLVLPCVTALLTNKSH